jgi:hypothetical protein
MRPGLLVSDRHSLSLVLVLIYRFSRSYHSRFVVAGSFRSIRLGTVLHLCTCTSHSGVKKTHDWSVGQITDFFRTTHKVKTQQVVRNRGHQCGDIELFGYLTIVTGPVTFPDKIRKYRADYNQNPPNTISFLSVIASTSGRLHFTLPEVRK